MMHEGRPMPAATASNASVQAPVSVQRIQQPRQQRHQRADEERWAGQGGGVERRMCVGSRMFACVSIRRDLLQPDGVRPAPSPEAMQLHHFSEKLRFDGRRFENPQQAHGAAALPGDTGSGKQACSACVGDNYVAPLTSFQSSCFRPGCGRALWPHRPRPDARHVAPQP